MTFHDNHLAAANDDFDPTAAPDLDPCADLDAETEQGLFDDCLADLEPTIDPTAPAPPPPGWASVNWAAEGVEILQTDAITADPGLQLRASLNGEALAEYQDRMEQGDKFPPGIAFDDGTTLWLAEGFHRYEAAKLAGFAFPVEVRKGTKIDALIHAAGANVTHGVRRTNADKRKAVETMLRQEGWWQRADADIAKTCRVSAPYIRKIRNILMKTEPETFGDNGTRVVSRNGKTFTMNTSGIGAKAKVASSDGGSEVEPPESSEPAEPNADGLSGADLCSSEPQVSEDEEPLVALDAASPDESNDGDHSSDVGSLTTSTVSRARQLARELLDLVNDMLEADPGLDDDIAELIDETISAIRDTEPTLI